MSNTSTRSGLVLAVLLAAIVAGCARTTGAEPSATPVAQPSDPAPATPIPTETPTPSQPPATPAPSDDPVVVVRFDPLTIARVTADAVALRVLPGLDQPLVDGYHTGDGTAPEVRLDSGATVAIVWGPLVVEGHTWYAVRHHDAGLVIWDEGWIAADYLAEAGRLEGYPLVATADGLGSGKAVAGTVDDVSPLYVNAVVTPMPGEASCEAEVVLIGTDGTHALIGSGTVSETTRFFSSPVENDDLYQAEGGQITLQVRTDCAWAAMAFEPIG